MSVLSGQFRKFFDVPLGLRIFSSFSFIIYRLPAFTMRSLVYMDMSLSRVREGSRFIPIHTFFLVCSALLVEDSVSSSSNESIWHFCQKSRGCKKKILYLCPQFYSIVPYVCFHSRIKMLLLLQL